MLFLALQSFGDNFKAPALKNAQENASLILATFHKIRAPTITPSTAICLEPLESLLDNNVRRLALKNPQARAVSLLSSAGK